MLDYELLCELCSTDGISGDEDNVRELIISEISGYADEMTVDNSGNLIVFKKGRKTPHRKLLLSAHMDEVGFIVTYITDDGYLKFTYVGGIKDSAVFAKQVKIGKKGINGVVCSKPVHLCKGDERKKYPEIGDMYIDIGAQSREQAETVVSFGDSIVFDSTYDENGSRIISKALDDRFGCLVLIEMIKSELPYDMYFSFVVQEEVGLRGARTAAFSVCPDSAIVIEATTASDVPGADGAGRVCLCGGGAVVSHMDRSTIYDKEYYRMAMECASENGIKVQTKTMIAGGNDAGVIHISGSGVRTAAVSIPCRYIHSSAGLAFKDDMEAVNDLVNALAAAILDKDV